jgi:hypothetical protein
MLRMALLAFLGVAQAAQPIPGDYDHSAYDRLLRAHVTLAGVDYRSMAKDQHALSAYVRSLATADMRTMRRRDRTAFWINAHNALVLQLILRHYPIRSVTELDGGLAFEERRYRVAGQVLTLKQIETEIVPHLGDPRVHAAINTGSRSSPPLANTAYSGMKIESQLAAASLRWARMGGIKVDRRRKTVRLCSSFSTAGGAFLPTWGASHFDIPGVDGVVEAGINFFAARHDATTRAWLQAGGYEVTPLTFNWDLNDRRGIR